MPPHHIRMFVCDVDGVLTDGSIRIDTEGRELKVFNVLDGTAVALLRLVGIDTAIISGRESAATTHRAAALKIEQVYQGVHRKLEALDRICHDEGVRPDEMAYIGDDLIDIPVLRIVGLPVTPADAHPLCRREAELVTTRRGGEGVLREAAEFVLRARGLFDAALAAYLGESEQPAPKGGHA